MMKDEEVRMVVNAHGIKIKVGCMSCQHRKIFEGVRQCGITDIEVESTEVCDCWQLSDGMKNAGLGTGVVKRRGTKEVIL